VKESNSGTVANLDARSIAAGIAAMLGDPAAARQMGRNGRQLVISRFTWPQLAKEMIDNYRQVIPA